MRTWMLSWSFLVLSVSGTVPNTECVLKKCLNGIALNELMVLLWVSAKGRKSREALFFVHSRRLQIVVQLCPALWEPMDCNTPGFPILHYLPELAQTRVHWVNDAIQSSHPLSSPCPPALNLSQHQSLFPMSWLFTAGGQSLVASASVLHSHILFFNTPTLTSLILLPRAITKELHYWQFMLTHVSLLPPPPSL